MVLHGTYETLGTTLLNLSAIEAGQTGATAIKRLSTTGEAARDADGLVWCPDRSAFASISSSNPTNIRWLKPSNPTDLWNSSWTWTKEIYSGVACATAVPVPNGAFSRFVWVPSIKCLLWSGDVNRKMQAYRP
jgi:hypothetical protein